MQCVCRTGLGTHPHRLKVSHIRNIKSLCVRVLANLDVLWHVFPSANKHPQWEREHYTHQICMCSTLAILSENATVVSGMYLRAMAYSPCRASLSLIRNTPSFIRCRHCSASIRDILPMNLPTQSMGIRAGRIGSTAMCIYHVKVFMRSSSLQSTGDGVHSMYLLYSL